MTLKLSNVTFDCEHADRLAAFWSAALGRPVAEGAADFFAVIPGADRQPHLLFIKVPEPKTAKNRCHVDLHTSDLEGEVARLIGLGATRVHDKEEWGVRWTTLTDPEGNEFCVAFEQEAAPEPSA